MSTSSNSMSEPVSAGATAALPATRPFYWSVRRELWENRSLYIAPLAVAGLILFGFTISVLDMGQRAAKETAALSPDSLAAAIILPYDIAAVAMIVVSVIVGFFYCLSALYSERRERSILFWKSLPVSNLTTVLSKAFMPLVVLPAITFGTVVAVQFVMLLLNSAGRLAIGTSVPVLWAHVPLVQMSIVLLYGLVTLALWHAPIYAWLILVSAWAKKTPILWALLPPLGMMLVERMAFQTEYFGRLLAYRLGGGFDAAFGRPAHLPLHIKAPVVAHAAHGTHHMQMPGVPVIGLEQLDPMKFLGTPGLWLGLIAAAVFLAAAVWLRRTREAI